LTAVNADAEEAISAESPAVAAATCASPPHAIPSADTSPALRPLSRLCVTTYVTAGPGTTISASAATQKKAKAVALGMTGQPYTRRDAKNLDR
jgi:hypothetical protein